MRISLTRKEITAFKNLANTMDSIEGAPVSRVTEYIDKQMTTKAYILSMITGNLTIEINEDMLLEFLAITNAFMKESSPILKAIFNLGQALAPTTIKYSERYSEFFDRYTPTAPASWNVISVETEKVASIEDNREVC